MSAKRRKEIGKGGKGALEIGWAGIAAPDSRRSIVSEGSRRPRTHFTRRVVLNGHPEYRLPNTLNVAFPNHVGADILARLDGVAALDRFRLPFRAGRIIAGAHGNGYSTRDRHGGDPLQLGTLYSD
jgi:hypothetical protein